MKKLRKGKITRPEGCTEPMIRVTGEPKENGEISDDLEIPVIPPSWEEILFKMFADIVKYDQERRQRGY